LESATSQVITLLRAAPAANMQWEKLKKSGAYPHLARWAAFLDAQPELADVAAAHGPYKPKAAAEYAKDLAAAGRGGGGKTPDAD